jgi:Uma2 family endonuclease
VATVSDDPTVERLPPSGQRLVLRDIDWPTYRTIADALKGRHVRLTYDRGTLEFMTISHPHGNLSRLLGRLIVVLTEELGMPVQSCGDMPCDREDLERALEPDESYYLRNEPLVRGKEEIDLTTDPPPDLAVEIDVTRNSRRRLGVYAALGVPEVWRFDGEALEVHRLGPGGQYTVSDTSGHFPQVPVQELAAFLRQRTQADENSLVRSFRDWVRQQVGLA